MNIVQLYTDETKEEGNNFTITTTIWGSTKSCVLYEKEISDIVLCNTSILGREFKGFHASRLRASNWNRTSPVYLQVIKKLFSFIKTSNLKLLIFIESNNKYNSNSGFLESMLKKYLSDKNSSIGQVFKNIKPENMIPIFKRADKIYNYLRNRDIFGNINQRFEYFPDSSGNILQYKNDSCFLESPNFKGIPIMEKYYDVIKMLTNALANSLNTLGDNRTWKKPIGQMLINFEPKDDKDSYLIQTADIISNFFYNLIKYMSGMRTDIIEKKAMSLLGFDAFRRHRNDTQKEFKIINRKIVCSNQELEVRFTIDMEKSDFYSRFLNV